jgi:hypothetical protein
LSSRIQGIQSTLNRLHARKAKLKIQQDKRSKSHRRARTRTLIQMGGLLHMIGLSELCGIHEGEDLQLDSEAMDKAAILLGMLVALKEELPPTLIPEQISTYKQKGIRCMKMNTKLYPEKTA